MPTAVYSTSRCDVKMTEPRDSTATGYAPISCDLHSTYELAILQHRWLRLVWTDNNAIHDETVLPLDLQTARGAGSRDEGGGTAAEEFLLCRTKGNAVQRIRLDRVRRMDTT